MYLRAMFYQKKYQMSFAGNYVERRIRKNTFFKQINMLIDWSEIEKEIKKVYKRGHSVDGRPAYSGLLLFKMLLCSRSQRVKPFSYGVDREESL